MKQAEIKGIWPAARKARISAKVRLPDRPTFLLGFDTEYISGKGDWEASVPVCWQWHDGERGAVMPLGGEPLKMSDLTRTALLLAQDRDPQARHIVLASWYALAELSVLDKDMKHKLLSHGSGLYGAQWTVTEEQGARRKKVTYTFTIFDLCAFYGRMSLAKASAHLPQPKGTWNHADTTLESVRIPEFQNYALQDAYLCHRLAQDLHSEFSLSWAVSPFEMLSVGYMSSALYRHHYVTADLFQPHPDVRALALTAYRGSGDYGGCWERGVFTGDFAEYDGTSMYPAACAMLGTLPRRNDWIQFRAEVWGDDFHPHGIYRAQIAWPEMEKRRTLMAQIPDEYGGETFGYPRLAVDNWTGYELHAARRAGCAVRIVTGFYAEDGTDSFSTFLGHTAHKRRKKLDDGRPALAAVYKNLGNTIIGKLGQHRAHHVYETVFNPETERVEYAPSGETRQGLGGVFMPEWWVLIVGYARAAMMDVIREKGALHAQVDAVLIPDCGESFEHMGIVFRRKSRGEVLRLAARNIWQFETGGEPVRFAAGGGARDLPELRQVMQTWTGQAIRHKYTVRDLVKMSEHARDPDGHPLLSSFTAREEFKIPALEVQK